MVKLLIAGLLVLLAATSPREALAQTTEDDPVVIKRNGLTCLEDRNCFNRIHPEIPMYIRARPGQTIIFETREAADTRIHPDKTFEDPRPKHVPGSTVHPVTGPVFIEGARAGDVLAVKILDVKPAEYGRTIIGSFGFIPDLFKDVQYKVIWDLNENWATTEKLPGIRIPYAAFPGIVMVLPDENKLRTILERERALHDAGGAVYLPEPVNASPEDLCGTNGSDKGECLRTIPPRELGGNLDIRYLRKGATLYLPCYVDGCGLGIGDVHYAQGDGEVSGTAIEMEATVTVKANIVRNARNLERPHFEGASGLMDIPSRRFYATVGYPFKEKGFVPPDMRYLESAKIAPLKNLSKDVSLAARDALIQMLEYLVNEKGLTREQAYILMSVAVDLRIGQVVDAPNVNVSAILPMGIFVED